MTAPGRGRRAPAARVLVLADPADDRAAAVAAAIAPRTSGPVTRLHPAHLGTARWVHRVSPSGRTATTLGWPDGSQIVDTDVAAVLVRTESLSLPRFTRSPPADRDYAAAELRALAVSWLQSLGSRVVNRVDGLGLTGPSWTPRRWLAEAARAGLPVVPTVAATSARLVPGWRGSPYDARRPFPGPEGGRPALGFEATVAGHAIAGPGAAAAERHRPACARLAAASGCRILGIDFEGPGPWARVTAAASLPALAAPVEVDAVAEEVAATAARWRAGDTGS